MSSCVNIPSSLSRTRTEFVPTTCFKHGSATSGHCGCWYRLRNHVGFPSSQNSIKHGLTLIPCDYRFSGVSWVSRDLGPHVITDWTTSRASNADQEKVPSAISYDKNGKVEYCGYEAIELGHAECTFRWFKTARSMSSVISWPRRQRSGACGFCNIYNSHSNETFIVNSIT